MKIFYSLLIMLAMGLSIVSCVDNVESDSVKAIRNAKATELLALADLHKAQAAADSLLANAEASLLEAQARYQNALAEGIEINNELAKATFDLEVEKIKAALEAEMNRLLSQIAMYKDDLKEELYNQLAFWLNKLNTESNYLLTLESIHATYSPYDVAQNEADAIMTAYYIKDLIAYYESFIAEYKKYIDANMIDWSAVYAATAAIETEIDVLYSKYEDLYSEIVALTDDLYYDVQWSNIKIFYLLEDLESYGLCVPNILDSNENNTLDENEGIIVYDKPYSAYYITHPTVRIDESLMILLSKYLNVNIFPMMIEAAQEAIGTETDKVDDKIAYANQTDYAIVNYWTERTETYTTKFKNQLLAAVDAVNTAKDAWAKAETDKKAKAEKDLVAALDALDKYTMVGADLKDPANGSFTLFLNGTYDTSSKPVGYYNPSTWYTSSIVVLASGPRTYYTIDELDLLMMEMIFDNELATAKDNLAEDVEELAQLQVNASDYYTIEELIYDELALHNQAIEDSYVLVDEIIALEDEIDAKEAELEAAMNALIAAEMYDNQDVVEVLMEDLIYYENIVAVFKSQLTLYESGTSTTIMYESLVKAINTTKANIERINAIIDQIEADMNALIAAEVE